MNNPPLLSDLHVFIVVCRNKSFNGAANELGKSPAFISKRIHVLETTLGCKLFARNTRHIGLTEEGKKIIGSASLMLTQAEELMAIAKHTHQQPSGALHITSSLGFGRQHVAPILSDLHQTYPLLNIRFDTTDRVYDLIEHDIDLDIHIGNEISPDLIAQKIYPNHRILCASPVYLAKHGTPHTLNELLKHQCLITKERDHPFGLWKLNSSHGIISIKVNGPLASNNGEMVKIWALAGHGIMLRSSWDVIPAIHDGRLVHVLPDYRQEADIWAVYPSRLQSSSSLRLCVDFISQALPKRLISKD